MSDRQRYLDEGYWRTDTLGEIIAKNAAAEPDRAAFIGTTSRTTWAEHDRLATGIANHLLDVGLQPGSRVAVILPDSPLVHATYTGIERAGMITVGIGPRAGRKEIEHLLGRTRATAIVATAQHREHDMAALAGGLHVDGRTVRHVVVGGEPGAWTFDGTDPLQLADGDPGARVPHAARLGPDDLFLLNSTSGTTGLPKVVMHHMNRWYGFHAMAAAAGELTSDDVILSAISAPFGFGLWTAHFTPTLLGAPCVVMDRFTVEEMIAAIERHRVTMLAAVSTQFIMMLESPAMREHDLSSLRVMFTGGEAVPYDRAARFEEETGASVLQFFGSNETGALSCTTTKDTRDNRLRTAGRVIPIMDVRLFDADGADITDTGGPGQPACRGPVTCLGYLDDPAANAELVRPDGWMMIGDIVTIDDDGYLRVVGRTSDFIIRGGKNISAPAVEEAVLAVPGVRFAAAVAVPSNVYGEKVCIYVVPADASAAPTLDAICEHLCDAGVTKDNWPEAMVIVDELPHASGGKVAKAALREDVRARVTDNDRGIQWRS